MPATDILVFDLKENETKVLVENPMLITSFNPKGYNNQPYFVDDQTLLFSSDYDCKTGTDIYLVDLLNNKLKRFSYTSDGEYSPFLNPNTRNIEIVRQASGTAQTAPQWLWSYPFDRSNGGFNMIPAIDNIGYFCPISEEHYALFLVDQTSELVLYDISTQKKTHIAYSVGRCLKRDKAGRLIYIQKFEGHDSQIRSFNPEDNSTRFLFNAIEGQDDFSLLKNGHLLSGKGSIIMQRAISEDGDWSPLIDLSSLGIKSISRIASSNNKIAVVVTR